MKVLEDYRKEIEKLEENWAATTMGSTVDDKIREKRKHLITEKLLDLLDDIETIDDSHHHKPHDKDQEVSHANHRQVSHMVPMGQDGQWKWIKDMDESSEMRWNRKENEGANRMRSFLTKWIKSTDVMLTLGFVFSCVVIIVIVMLAFIRCVRSVKAMGKGKARNRRSPTALRDDIERFVTSSLNLEQDSGTCILDLGVNINDKEEHFRRDSNKAYKRSRRTNDPSLTPAANKATKEAAPKDSKPGIKSHRCEVPLRKYKPNPAHLDLEGGRLAVPVVPTYHVQPIHTSTLLP